MFKLARVNEPSRFQLLNSLTLFGRLSANFDKGVSINIIACFPVQQAPSEKGLSLRKHAYSNILKISHPKTESFHIKLLIFFIFLLKT